MSTYYWLCCDNHREIAPACSYAGGRPVTLHDMEDCLPAFCYVHCECALRIVSEHQHESDDFHLWTRENVEEMESLERKE